DPLAVHCPEGPILSTPDVLVTVTGPTILPDQCHGTAKVPFVEYWCDPHGAVHPLSGTVGWKSVPVTFEFTAECSSGQTLIGDFLSGPGQFPTWSPKATVVWDSF